jgi:hypothetical protein
MDVPIRRLEHIYFRKGDHWVLRCPDDGTEYLSVVTEVMHRNRAAFTWVMRADYVEELTWPFDKKRLVCLALAGPE